MKLRQPCQPVTRWVGRKVMWDARQVPNQGKGHMLGSCPFFIRTQSASFTSMTARDFLLLLSDACLKGECDLFVRET